MHMILSRVLLLAIHKHSRDAEIVIFLRRETDLAAAILGAVNLNVGNPAFGETLSDAGAHVFIIVISRSVFGVELCFECFAGCAVHIRWRNVKGREGRTGFQFR
jgi:hypothetical protein